MGHPETRNEEDLGMSEILSIGKRRAFFRQYGIDDRIIETPRIKRHSGTGR